MTAYITGYDGTVYTLPSLTGWTFKYTADGTADGFEIVLEHDTEVIKALADAVRFSARENGETVFTGIVDEYEAEASENGCSITVSGRGVGGILLDNEAESGQYLNCSLNDIIREHVEPYGITDIKADKMGSLKNFTVKSGQSEWKVLTEFCRWAGDEIPRFSKDGQLVISDKESGTVVLGMTNGVCSARIREKRYGVVSEVIVKGNTNRVRTTVKNEEFIRRGGKCRRIISVPNKTSYDARKYTGEYIIEESEKNSFLVVLGFAEPFAAFAGDKAKVSLPEMGIEEELNIVEAVTWADGTGCGTELTMVRR